MLTSSALLFDTNTLIYISGVQHHAEYIPGKPDRNIALAGSKLVFLYFSPLAFITSPPLEMAPSW